jgi:hypothetical protein
MLQVQEYLRSGKTLDNLKSELGVNYVVHDSYPLVILNYDQIESPKINPIVRECRGLVLEMKTYNLVSRSFNRFFNCGEHVEEMKLFDFSKFHALSKEDGSLVNLYNYKNKWFANTRGSFGHQKIQSSDITWHEGFCKALKVNNLDELKLDPSLTYSCEYCSVYNKVVRMYKEPVMYLLSVFRGHQELSLDEIDLIKFDNFLFPERFLFNDIKHIQDFLNDKAKDDPTFEGVVIHDGNLRFKIKNTTYMALHALKGDGDNLFLPKNLLPFILSGEEDELLIYYPEVTETYYEYKQLVDKAYAALLNTWRECWPIEDQKTFAIAISGKTPFTGLLFTLRKKYGKDQSEELLKSLWKSSSDAILKHLFNKYKGL